MLTATTVPPVLYDPQACADAVNHGAYVSFVAHATKGTPDHGALVSAAAQSDCGKADKAEKAVAKAEKKAARAANQGRQEGRQGGEEGRQGRREGSRSRGEEGREPGHAVRDLRPRQVGRQGQGTGEALALTRQSYAGAPSDPPRAARRAFQSRIRWG